MQANELSQESGVWDKSSHAVNSGVHVLVQGAVCFHGLDALSDGVNEVFPGV